MTSRTLCVFCGSKSGDDPAFRTAALGLGTRLAERGIALVYGGASVGLMGAVADAVVSSGGHATGVITEALAGHEIAHGYLHDLHVVCTMHERKALMAELADAFVMLPGGFGTWEEFMESVTWAQLGIHDKRCGILNVSGSTTSCSPSWRAPWPGDSSRRARWPGWSCAPRSMPCSTRCSRACPGSHSDLPGGS